jgi:hypothetical protein
MAELDAMMQPVTPPIGGTPAPVAPEPEKEEFDEEQICEEARERFAQCDEDDRQNRENSRDDFKFVYSPGEQWTEQVKQRRKGWDEPCLEFNQLGQFVNQVIGDERQNKPAILVHPANGQASKEVAEIQQGIIRGIEYESQAEAAYDNGFQGAVVGGRGWWRVCTEWKGATFNQRICIKPILDALSVYADLNYEQPDASDRAFAFVVEKVQKTEFERRWPDASAVSWDALDDLWKDGKDVILVADYYRRVPKMRTLVAMSDGAVGWKDTMPKPPPGITQIRSREVETYSIEWHKIAGGEQLLESHKLPGEIIPVIQTAGVDILLDGKRVYQGLIRPARDAQTMFNFGMTAQAIHLALTPRAPWVAPQEAIEDYKEIWKDANTKNYSVLPFKHKDSEGKEIPRPTRTEPSQPDAGWINWCQTMQGVMRSTIGMYQNSLGQQGTETSGIAIRQREKQGDTGTFHFVDNQHRAIALTGRVIQSWIPTYYDTEQIVQIIGPDDTRKMVTINQNSPNPSNPLEAIRLNDVTVGEYAVVVEAGPGYATKRQETSDKLMQLVQSFPPIAQAAGDLVVKSLDVADADLIADRLKMMLPPPIQQAMAAQEGGGKPPDPATMQKMGQLMGQIEEMKGALQELQQRNQELESGAAIEGQKLEVKARGEAEERAIRARSDQENIMLAERKAQAEINLKRRAAEDEDAYLRWKAELDNQTKLEIAAMNKSVDLRIAQMQPAPEPENATPS